MNETMLAVLGFATIIMIIVLLLRNVTVPALAFAGVSTVTSVILVATGTFTVEEMGEFIASGVAGVHSTAALFIFSVLFFGIMTDVGMFDRIINALMKKVGSLSKKIKLPTFKIFYKTKLISLCIRQSIVLHHKTHSYNISHSNRKYNP